MEGNFVHPANFRPVSTYTDATYGHQVNPRTEYINESTRQIIQKHTKVSAYIVQHSRLGLANTTEVVFNHRHCICADGETNCTKHERSPYNKQSTNVSCPEPHLQYTFLTKLEDNLSEGSQSPVWSAYFWLRKVQNLLMNWKLLHDESVNFDWGIREL